MKIKSMLYINSCGGISSDCPTEPSRADFDVAMEVLLKNDVPVGNDNSKYGCAPVRDCYYALVPDCLIPVIKQIYGFIPVKQYPKGCGKAPKEIGCIGNARIIKVSDDKSLLDNLSLEENNIYGIEFKNDLKARGHLALYCTLPR